MTNPTLKTKLVYIMEQEKRTKINLIGAILDTKQGTNIDINAEFNRLYCSFYLLFHNKGRETRACIL